MAEDIALKTILLKNNIAKICGLYRPCNSPNYLSVSEKTASPFEYGSKEWLTRFCTPELITVFDDLTNVAKLPVTGRVCANNPMCVHALRITGYYLRTVWIPTKDAKRSTNNPSLIYQCGLLILCAIKTAAKIADVEDKKTLREVETRLTEMINEKHSRYNTLKSIYRSRFPSHYYTTRKTVVCRAVSDLITERWETAVEDLHREVQPGINYARRLATLELIVHQCTNMTSGQLLSFNDLLRQCHEVQPALLKCSDNLHLLTLAYLMGRARLNTKLIEVNPKHCRCFAKCLGAYGNEKRLERFAWESFDRHAGLLVCGVCRLSPVIENTTAEKPRRTYSSITPEVESCSADACTSFKFVRLVVQDVRVTETGFVHIRYAHRVFTTNSVNVTDEVNNGKKTGPQSRMYGMCYGGNRSCLQRFIILAPSLNSNNAQDPTPFADLDHWFKCESCRSSSRKFGAVSSLNLCPNISDSTCLRKYFSKSDFPKELLCRGCKIAATCPHLDEVLYLRTQADVRRVCSRIKRLTDLRRWLSTGDGWV